MMIIRSNQNAVMYVHNDHNGDREYLIFNLRNREWEMYTNLNSARSRWNRTYANSRQHVVKGNHRYLIA